VPFKLKPRDPGVAMAKKNTPPLPPLRSMPIRIAKLHGKLLVAAVVGIVVTMLVPGHWRMATQLLVGWNVGVAIYLGLTHAMFIRCNVERIRKRAAEQDEGEYAILLLTIVATIASLVAIIFQLGGLKQALPGDGVIQVLMATVTILLSWSFIHTIFSIHYAHEYYGERRDGIIGGLKFPGDAKPDYWDFLYFSLVIAMTSQVSDVVITSKSIRHVVSMHGVLSFFFNLTVLALTVNMVSNLI
jgi:uncharacterized membrane protein